MPTDAATSALPDYVFVVNPSGANGRTGQQWKRMLPDLNSRLGKDCNIREALTSGPLHAIEIAKKAVRDGAAAVIAVGGDGTLLEVLNGFFEDGKLVRPREARPGPRTALGLIPMGTGSDLARHFGWKSNDSHQAIDRLVKDGGQWIVIPQVTAVCVGNAKHIGGGMKITPTADPFYGRLEVQRE